MLVSAPAEAGPVVVRFPKGIAHGYLFVRSLAGKIIGQGEMTQVGIVNLLDPPLGGNVAA